MRYKELIVKLQLIVTLLLLVSCNSNQSDSSKIPIWLLGAWKSNEGLTLEDMSRIEGMPEKQKSFLSDNFFGRLVVIFRETDSASFFLEDIDQKKYELYEGIVATDNSVAFKSFSEVLNKEITNTFYLDGECIYGVVTKYEFKEYFCRYLIEQ